MSRDDSLDLPRRLKPVGGRSDPPRMHEFNGTLILEDNGGAGIPARAAVVSGRLSLSVGGTEVGSWALDDVTVKDRTGRVDVVAGGEHIEFDLSNSAAFVDAVTAQVATKRGTKGKSKQRRVPKQALRKPDPKARSRRKLSPVVAVLGIAVVVLGVSIYFYSELVASIALLAGLLLLTLGSVATTEPKMALRIPFGLSALSLVATGGALVVAGMGLVLVG